jgi:hypothetical protein
VYNNGISVLRTAFPIKTLESIKKVDFATGAETPLAVSAAVISADKLSFTHPSLANGDIVFFTYFYDYNGVNGENVYGYLDSNHVIADTANGKFYKYKPAITNGVVTGWTVTEAV